MYENFKSENLKKEHYTLLIIPYWWDGKLARYKITYKKLEKQLSASNTPFFQIV
jgi:hypothetical protein